MSVLKILFQTDASLIHEAETANYNVVLLLTGSSVGLSLFDNSSNQYIFLAEYNNTLTEVKEEFSWLSGIFRSVNVIVENNLSTIVPLPLFMEEEKEQYLAFSSEIPPLSIIRSERLSQPEMVIVYAIPREQEQEINSCFPEATVCHLSSILIETVWINYKNLIGGTEIFIYAREENFNLLIFDKKQLIYHNAFLFRAPEDLTYYLIFVMEQLNLNPEEIPVRLLGKIVRDSSLFALIYRYIRNISFVERNDPERYHPVFTDVPEHFYYPLLNRGLCGS